MPRKPLIRSKEFPYHVTARSNNRAEFPLSLSKTWAVHTSELSELETQFKVKIHAFVLMPNHFHLLISTPEEDLGLVMMNFMRSVTKIMNAKTGRSGRIFGGRYHWCLIDTMSYFDCALKYVYRNPVKGNLCESVENYSFSTLNTALGKERLKFNLHPPIGETTLIPGNEKTDFLEWLNIPFLSEEDAQIKSAFEKTVFRPLPYLV